MVIKWFFNQHPALKVMFDQKLGSLMVFARPIRHHDVFGLPIGERLGQVGIAGCKVDGTATHYGDLATSSVNKRTWR